MEVRFTGLKNRNRMQVERLRKRLIKELRNRGEFVGGGKRSRRKMKC